MIWLTCHWLSWHWLSWHLSSSWHWGSWHWGSWHRCSWHVIILWSRHSIIVLHHTLMWSLMTSLHLMLIHLSISSMVLEASSSMTTSVVPLLILSHIGNFVLLHDFNQLLENLGHIWVRNEVIQMESTCLLGSISFEILLINHFMSFELSDFLDLIVIYDELLSFNSLIVEGLFGLGSSIWSHVTNKSVDCI